MGVQEQYYFNCHHPGEPHEMLRFSWDLVELNLWMNNKLKIPVNYYQIYLTLHGTTCILKLIYEFSYKIKF